MPESKEDKISVQILKTQEIARAFVEDYDYLKNILPKENHNSAELRRASVVIRRFIIHGDLSLLASPRLRKKPELLMPDNTLLYASARKREFNFFMSAGVFVLGKYLRALIYDKNIYDRVVDKNFNPDSIVSCKIDSFKKQKVLCYEGKWFTRSDIIEYVANYSSAAHSGQHQNSTEKEDILSNLRHTARVVFEEDFYNLDINEDGLRLDKFDKPIDPFPYAKGAIDCVLIELLVIINSIVNSSDVKSLYEYIMNDLTSS